MQYSDDDVDDVIDRSEEARRRLASNKPIEFIQFPFLHYNLIGLMEKSLIAIGHIRHFCTNWMFFPSNNEFIQLARTAPVDSVSHSVSFYLHMLELYALQRNTQKRQLHSFAKCASNVNGEQMGMSAWL